MRIAMVAPRAGRPRQSVMMTPLDPAAAAGPMTFPAAIPVAIQSFSAFERTALASFFRLAEQRAPTGATARPPFYVLVDDAARAALLIVDADDDAAIAAARRAGRLRDAVFIGAQAPAGALAWLPRPIAPLHIVRALDALAQRRRSAAHAAVAASEPVEKPASPAMNVDVLLTDLGGPIDAATRIAPTLPQTGGAGRLVLVVDDSAIARRFLARRLERYGYRVQLAADGEAALAWFERQTFVIAFVDITLGPAQVGGIDGLRVCQAIKQRGQPDGIDGKQGGGTAVVIVTGQTSATVRVRGSLAGCDAYLTKPLMEAEFIAALHLVDPLFQSGLVTAGMLTDPTADPTAG